MTESYGTITITDTTDIAKIENWYLASNKSSGVTISESGWTTDVTNTNAVMTATKQYLWNYEKILGTGDVVINTTTPVIIGRYGQNGGAGKGISSIDEYYQITNSTTNPGSSGWQKNTLVVPTASNPYLWNYQVINYVNPTSTEGTYADARIIGVYGDKGDTGTSVSSTIKYYQLATSKPSKPTNNAAIPSGWSTTQPTFDSSKLTYTLYTVIQTTYSNGNIVYSAVQVDSAFEAAKVAYQKAQAAQTNAGDALTSANGKNTIYYQVQKPTEGTYQDGDTWFKLDSNGNTIEILNWDQNQNDWVSTQLGQNTIMANAIKARHITVGAVDANKISVNNLAAIKADMGEITAGSLSKGNNFISLDDGTLEFKNASTFANSSQGIQWDGNSLNIKGNLTVTGGNAATTAQAQGYATTVQNNLTTKINSTRSWYAECLTAAATAAKEATITPTTTDFTLTAGTTVAVKFTYTNTVANPTLNVNGTGAIAIMRYGTTAPSTSAKTSWQANSINTLTYDGTYWRLNNWLNDDTTYNLGRNLHATPILVLEAVASGYLMAGTASGYKKIAAGRQFSLSYPLLYASAAYAVNTAYSNTYETWNSVTYTNTAAIQSGAANKTIYLKGKVSANTFTIDSTNVFTTIEPTSADGCFYIPLGILSSTTIGNFSPSSSLYAFIDGRFRQVTPTEIMTSHRVYYRTASSSKPAAPTSTWVAEAENDTNTYNAWTTKIPPLATSTASGQIKYLYLYTCEQRKRLDGTIQCTDVQLDENTTVIDGGNIITGSIKANQIDVDNLFAQDITASGKIIGATIQGANGTFTKGFDVDIFFDFVNGTVVEDLSELQTDHDYAKQYFRVESNSVKMGYGAGYFDTENQEWVDGGEHDYFIHYRNPAHPGTPKMSLAAYYITLDGYDITLGSSSSSSYAKIYGELNVSNNITAAGDKITLSSNSGNISLHNSGNNAGLWDTTNGDSGYWLIAHKFSNDHAYIGKHLEVPYNATIKDRKMVYEAGDSINCDGLQCAGHLTTSKTDVAFFIPLPKPTGPNLKATVSGNWTVRHADGGYILNNAALTTIGTLASVAIYDLGVYVRVRLTTASSFTNNSPICVSGSSAAKVTFSANS